MFFFVLFLGIVLGFSRKRNHRICVSLSLALSLSPHRGILVHVTGGQPGIQAEFWVAVCLGENSSYFGELRSALQAFN